MLNYFLNKTNLFLEKTNDSIKELDVNIDRKSRIQKITIPIDMDISIEKIIIKASLEKAEREIENEFFLKKQGEEYRKIYLKNFERIESFLDSNKEKKNDLIFEKVYPPNFNLDVNKIDYDIRDDVVSIYKLYKKERNDYINSVSNKIKYNYDLKELFIINLKNIGGEALLPNFI